MFRFAQCYVAAIALGAGMPAAAIAQESTCRTGLFAQQESFAQARVAEKRRTFFYRDTDGCPTRAGVTDECRSISYVIEGDMLVTGRSLGEFVCAFFPNDRGGTERSLRARCLSTTRWKGAGASGCSIGSPR